MSKIALRAPVLMKLDSETPDGRTIKASGFRGIAEGKQAKVWVLDMQSSGHYMARIAGGLDVIEVADAAEDGSAVVSVPDEGAWLLADDFGIRAANLVDAGLLIGASVDLDDDYVVEYVEEFDSETEMWKFKIIFTEASLAGFTLVDRPAFPDAHVQLSAELPEEWKYSVTTGEPARMAKLEEEDVETCEGCEEAEPCATCGGQYAEQLAAFESMLVGAKTITSFVRVNETYTPPEVLTYPVSLFQNPELRRLTPFQYEPSTGRIFGHLAGWKTCHGALPTCVLPPRSHTNYRYFANTPIHASDGSIVYVGRLVCDTVHAKVRGINAETASAHYMTTGTVFGLVAIGDDEFGPWVSGAAVRIDPEMLTLALSCPPSGDWRPIMGVPGRELIAGLAVPVPGYNTPRSEFGIDKDSGLIISNVPLDPPGGNGGELTPELLGRFDTMMQQIDLLWSREAARLAEEATENRRRRIAQLTEAFA